MDGLEFSPDKLVTLAQIEDARRHLPRAIRHTPVVPLARDSAEVGHEKLFLKCENLQVTGAFKIRAVFNLMRHLTPEDRAKGVVLASSGNFAQGFAYAGRVMGAPITVVMLDATSPYKIRGTEGYGAEVCLCGDDALARQPTVEQLARERGMTAVDTWEDPPIIAGHGTIGWEIMQDCPDAEQVLVPISSGGVAGGIAAAAKLLNPKVRVVGVQPEGANAAYVSCQKGQPTAIDHWDSIADGLSARRPGEYPFMHLQEFLDDIVLVSETDIANSFKTILYRTKMLGEPAGVTAAAGFLSGKVDTNLKTVAALTGGNLTEATVAKLMEMADD
ncbi:MAG: threonine/serine dehydratase [Rhodospirillaceae bacterium]